MTKSFDHNDKAAIVAALSDTDPENDIAKAIAMRIEALSNVLFKIVRERGELPESIEFAKPSSALDEAVIMLFLETFESQYAAIAEMLGKDASQMPPMPKIVILEHGRQ